VGPDDDAKELLMAEQYVLAIDQGTTSTRAIIFDHGGQIVATGQTEHQQIFPKAGWVEHDPNEIWTNTREVVGLALSRANKTYSDIVAVGITNQRETAVVWDRTTGQPVYNAIVWQDTRTQKICDDLAALGGGAERYKERVGLPLATYFSGRSAGSSTTSRAPARRPSAASSPSATPTPGCCGT
jgi:glycerol kinase